MALCNPGQAASGGDSRQESVPRAIYVGCCPWSADLPLGLPRRTGAPGRPIPQPQRNRARSQRRPIGLRNSAAAGAHRRPVRTVWSPHASAGVTACYGGCVLTGGQTTLDAWRPPLARCCRHFPRPVRSRPCTWPWRIADGGRPGNRPAGESRPHRRSRSTCPRAGRTHRLRAFVPAMGPQPTKGSRHDAADRQAYVTCAPFSHVPGTGHPLSALTGTQFPPQSAVLTWVPVRVPVVSCAPCGGEVAEWRTS